MGEAETASIRRRAFLQGSTLLLTGGPLFASESNPDGKETTLALVTDLHYADKPRAGSRHYRQTLDKLSIAAEEFGEAQLDFLVELGDFIDAADSVETEIRYLKRVNEDFRSISPNRHYVLGNHCVDTLRKQEFLNEVEQSRSYYSFDVDGFHFVVLDACFRSDGTPYERKNFKWTDANIPQAELDWLRNDLAANQKPVIVFAHQRLDVAGNHQVKNAPEVRTILEQSERVQAVFQGHSHQNELQDINGIHYCTMVAMVEGDGMRNNGYSLVTLAKDGSIRVDGFARQASYEWKERLGSHGADSNGE